jgi:hypothetical protein
VDAKEYRRRAHYYLALANEMTSYPNRVAILELAGIWMRLAEQAELNERVVKQLEEMWRDHPRQGRQLRRP